MCEGVSNLLFESVNVAHCRRVRGEGIPEEAGTVGARRVDFGFGHAGDGRRCVVPYMLERGSREEATDLSDIAIVC